MRIMVIFALMAALLFFTAPASAGDGAKQQRLEQLVRELIKENRQLNSRLANVEKELATLKKRQAYAKKEPAETEGGEQEEQGEAEQWYKRFSLSGDVTGILMGTLGDANSMDRVHSTQDASYTIDFNVNADFARWGRFFVHFEGGDGDGLNNDVPSFSVPNYDAYKTTIGLDQAALTISEAFYEFSFLDNKFGMDVGKMDISVLFDQNEAAGDETTEFLSNIFVKSMGVNIPEPDSFYCPAFMLRANPTDMVEFRIIGAGVAEHGDDSVWTDPFDNGMIIGQMNIMPGLFGRKGNYRFYSWLDKRRYMKVNELSKLPELSHEAGHRFADNSLYGWGLSFDQELLTGITGFARFSQTITNDRVTWNWDDNKWEILPVEGSWSVGFQLDGGLWNRGGDAFGLGFAETLLSHGYEKTRNHTAGEKYIEAYYRLGIVSRFALTGDFQWIKNAGGDTRMDDIYIWGVRSQIDF